MDFLCNNRADCFPCYESPIGNLTVEDDETFQFWRFEYNPPDQPPPLNRWRQMGCLALCTSEVSQQDADLCAARQAQFCNPPPPPDQLTFSAAASCTKLCPDGTAFTYFVPAGLFVADSALAAQAAATAYACRQAELLKLCLGDLPSPVCEGVFFSEQITVTGQTRAIHFSIVSGSLPPGVSLVPAGMACFILGTPTATGSYSFTIQAFDNAGNHMQKGYTLVVAGITNASILPPATAGTPYSFQFTAVGFVSPVFASNPVFPDALPSGLTFSPSGLLSGTPTVSAVFSFPVTVHEAP